MKKNILLIAALALLTLGFTSCEKESEGLTRITYYATLELEGPTYTEIHKGDPDSEPGYSAVMQGKDVTSQVKVTGSVNPQVAGVYTVVYSIENADGFVSSSSRTVIVIDADDPIQGHWTVTPTSFRSYKGNDVEYGDSFDILIVGNNGDGNYYVDDLFAGWYAQRAGYGSNYAMEGVIKVADDGTITLLESLVAGWGDSLAGIKDGKYDSAAKQIVYKATYVSGMVFDVTLNKVEE